MNLAFLDIETTGLDFIKHQPIEVGIVFPHKDPIHFSLWFDPNEADPIALEVNRYRERKREGTWPMPLSDKVACVVLQEELRDHLLVVNNVQFDVKFLEHFMRSRQQAEPTWHYNPMDLKSFVGGVLLADGYDLEFPFSSSQLAALLNVPYPGTHNALDDARWNHDLYVAAREYTSLPRD